MRRATTHHPAETWPSDQAEDSITLDFDARHRRRIVLTADSGAEFLLDLDRAVAMGEGDGLCLEDGGWIAVRAAPEPVIEITAATPELLLRLGWHIGNRHLPAEITAGAIYIRPDKVIEDMLRDLGANLAPKERPFQPEGGAYGHGRTHSHAHGNSAHDHAHAH